MARMIFTGALFLSLLAVIACSPIDSELPGENGVTGLSLMTISPNTIEGEYVDETGGVFFLTEVDGDFYCIQVDAANGEPILTMKGSNNLEYVNFLGSEFVFLSNFSAQTAQVLITPYFVPSDFPKDIENTINQGDLQELMNLLKELDQEGVEQEESDAIVSLLQCPEAELIVKAAKAIENSGIEGSEDLAATTFQDFAMQIKIAKLKLINQEQAANQSHAYKRGASRYQCVRYIQIRTLVVCIQVAIPVCLPDGEGPAGGVPGPPGLPDICDST